MRAYSIILVSAVFSGWGLWCTAGKKPKVGVVFDVRSSKIVILPLRNDSRVEMDGFWPKDTTQARVCLEKFKEIDKRLDVALQRNAGAGMYHLVGRESMATHTVQLRLSPYQVKNDTLIIPVIIIMEDRLTGKTVKASILARGWLDVPEKGGCYYYWGRLLESFVRRFPCQDIAMMFCEDLRKK